MIVSKRSKAQGATRLIHTAELNANQKYNSLNNTLNKTGFLFLSPRLPLSKKCFSLSTNYVSGLWFESGLNLVEG